MPFALISLSFHLLNPRFKHYQFHQFLLLHHIHLYLLHSSLFLFICNTNRLFLSFLPSFLSYQQVLSVLSENSDLLIEYYMTDQGTIFSGQYEGERERKERKKAVKILLYQRQKTFNFTYFSLSLCFSSSSSTLLTVLLHPHTHS